MSEERFAIHFTPLPTAARVTARRSALRWRIATFILSTIIFGAIMWLTGKDQPMWWNIVLGVLWVGTSLVWLVFSAVGLSWAKKDLARIQPGVSFYIEPEGIEFVEPQAVRRRWEEIDAVTVTGHRQGAGPQLTIVSGGEQVAKVPFSFLDANASVIDSMIRAYSLGAHRLDARLLELVV